MTDRIEKVNRTLQKEIGSIIQFEVKDPRVEFVTVTHVEVSRDLQHARVYFTVLGDTHKIQAAHEGLQHARGFIRRLAGQRMHMRYTPEIDFIFDESLERSFRIQKTFDD